MPELAQPTTAKRGSPGRTAIRVIIAVVVLGGVVWFVRSRHQEPAGNNAAAAASGRGGGGDGGGGAGRAGAGGAEGRVVTVQVATVEKKDLPVWVEGLGTVAAMQQVTVRPQVDGRIDKVFFTEGQMVKRGDVLMQIDPRPFLVQLHQAQGSLERDKAQLAANESNLRRQQSLLAQNLVASQAVEDAQGTVGNFAGAVKIDQSAIENAQLMLDYAAVKSPLDGITGVRQVDAGNLIHQTDANGIVVITQIDPAAVFFTIPQDQLAGVVQAMARGDVPVEVMSRDGVNKLAVGKLAVLDNQINQTTASLRLKALVPNPSRMLWPNAFVKARMLIETRKDAIVVPTVAVQRGPGGTYVYAVGEDKTAQMKPVTVALTSGEVAVVEKGLSPGERVIIEGQNQVRPGGKVEPALQNAGGPSGPGGGDGSGTAAAGPGEGSGHGRGRHGPGAGNGSSTRSREPATGPTASNQPAPQ
ncbi:MAG TPA: efflux RND transporter periplasmic adaptor subunit [Kofleriaceae bacterium]|nr:efflux RND transporter periplasmic adaptor subunit [Kofleriaceae bacterium]